jgi:hypothetical protein
MNTIKTKALAMGLTLIILLSCIALFPNFIPTATAITPKSPPSFLTYENVTSSWGDIATTSRIFMATSTGIWLLNTNSIYKSTDGLSFNSVGTVPTLYGVATNLYITSNNVIMITSNTSTSYYLLTSHDNAVSWNVALTTDYSLRWWQPTSVCDNGLNIWFGCYSALPGKNALVFQSSDNGTNFNQIYNYSLSNNVDHVHTINYDFVNNALLINCGDSPKGVYSLDLASNVSSLITDINIFTASNVVGDSVYYWMENAVYGATGQVEKVIKYNMTTQTSSTLSFVNDTLGLELSTSELFYGFASDNNYNLQVVSTRRGVGHQGATGVYLLYNDNWYTLIANASDTFGFYWLTIYNGWIYINFNDNSLDNADMSIMRLREPTDQEIPYLSSINGEQTSSVILAENYPQTVTVSRFSPDASISITGADIVNPFLTYKGNYIFETGTDGGIYYPAGTTHSIVTTEAYQGEYCLQASRESAGNLFITTNTTFGGNSSDPIMTGDTILVMGRIKTNSSVQIPINAKIFYTDGSSDYTPTVTITDTNTLWTPFTCTRTATKDVYYVGLNVGNATQTSYFDAIQCWVANNSLVSMVQSQPIYCDPANLTTTVAYSTSIDGLDITFDPLKFSGNYVNVTYQVSDNYISLNAPTEEITLNDQRIYSTLRGYDAISYTILDNEIFGIFGTSDNTNNITDIGYSVKELTFYTNNSGIATFQVYIGTKSSPLAVIGATAWSYTEVTHILSLSTSNSQNVTIYWEFSGTICGVPIDRIAKINGVSFNQVAYINGVPQ